MKICLISFFYYPYETGGADHMGRVIAESLKKRGFDVFVITTGPENTPKPFSEEIQNGIKVYRFYPFGTWIPQYKGKISNIGRFFTFLLNFWNPHSYFIIKKILKKENPDVVHIHEVPYLSLSAYSAAKSLNLPIVSTIRSVILLFPYNNLPYLDKIAGIKYPFFGSNYKIYSIFSKVYRWINKTIILYNSPRYVTFPTKAIMDIYNKYNFFENFKKAVTPNFIEINDKELKKEETNKETFDIMYCGGCQLHKGGQTLIEAFKKIKDKNIRLHIFGGGIYEAYFKNLSGCDKRIIFYGQIPNEKLQQFYKSADVVVVPSIYFESFSGVTLESLRAGVPVIGSNLGAIPELIKDGYNGFLFEPGNVEQLKKILEYVIENRNKLEKMRGNCIDSVKRYREENNIYKLVEIYKKVMKSNKK